MRSVGWRGMKGLLCGPAASIAVTCAFIVKCQLFTIWGSCVLCEFNSAGATLPRFPFLSDSSSGLVEEKFVRRFEGEYEAAADFMAGSEGLGWKEHSGAPARTRLLRSTSPSRLSKTPEHQLRWLPSSLSPRHLCGRGCQLFLHAAVNFSGQRQMWEAQGVSVGSSLCVGVQPSPHCTQLPWKNTCLLTEQR